MTLNEFIVAEKCTLIHFANLHGDMGDHTQHWWEYTLHHWKTYKEKDEVDTMKKKMRKMEQEWTK